jgi:hypothetical protein
MIDTLKKLYLFNDNVLNIYRFGSCVYGTNNENSDEDFIIIAKEYFDPKDINIHVYTVTQFQTLLNNCDIQMLECYFMPYNDNIIKMSNGLNIKFKLDKTKLRVAISTIVSNSWVKGKKKLIVQGDYDLNLAIKSTFHSLRILDFGTQIAMEGRIINYGSMNWVLADLKNMSTQYQSVDLWNAIDTKYRPIYNKNNSKFKELCPKDLTEKDNKSLLVRALTKYKINNEDLVNDILAIFQK